ncbi:MAG: hypothetical protein WCL44_04270 [bacterium]
MIIDKPVACMRPAPRSVSAIIEEAAGFVDPTDEEGLRTVREVAKGVEAYLGDCGDLGAGAGRVRALTTRALISSGKAHLGRKLMLAGGGLVKATRSALVEDGVVLTLNLRGLTVRHDERLDLVLRRCLLLVIDSMAPMWDQSGGRGMLGLRNLRAAAVIFLGHSARPGQVNRFVRDTMNLCADRLDVLGKRRGWAGGPVVCDLDWVSKRAGRQRKEGKS